MNSIQKSRQENSPYLQLLMLVAYAILGMVICIILAFGVLFAIYGMELFRNPLILTGGDIKYRPALQILLFAQSAGLFLIPPFLLSLTEGQKLSVFYNIKQPGVKLGGLVLLIMLVSMPVMEWTALINQQMSLPGYLSGLENWMKQSEESLKQTTLLLLKMDSLKDFLINIFLVAFVAAISEEFMFRGAVQRTLIRMFNNTHIAIWVSAFIFSAIHLQFYGFLPRFLLGAGFGYLYVWSGSLWCSILAHFLNNAIAVCQAYYMQKHNMPLDEVDNTAHFHWYGYLISFMITIALFQLFKNQSKPTVKQPTTTLL
ncbi:membrane protease YdiL (CAAX protease family) [Pedobacter sp. UYP24]